MGLFDAIYAGYGCFKERVELVGTGREVLDSGIDLYNEGQLDTIIVLGALFLLAFFYLRIRKGRPRLPKTSGTRRHTRAPRESRASRSRTPKPSAVRSMG